MAGALMNRTCVLYVEGNPDGTIGGSFYSLLYLIENLDRSKYDVVVVFAARHSMLGRFEAAGARVHIRPPARPLVLSGIAGRWFAKLANFFIGFVFEPLRLARFMRREGIGLVHLNNSIIRNHAWGAAAWYARIPCVTHERGINERYSRRSLWLGRRYRAVICISGAVKESLVRGGASNLNLEVIPNGLDPKVMVQSRPIESLRVELGISSSTRVIGIVGNIKSWKGQDVVVRAFASLRTSIPDIVCLLVGDSATADAEYFSYLRRLIQDLGVQSSVILTGYQANVADFVGVMEIVVHASVAPEPFGRVLLEGMAMRKPIVASRDGGVAEIVVDGVTGLLFTPGEAGELRDCLEVLLEHPLRASAMGEEGYKRLCNHFHVRQNVSKTQDLYCRVLSQRDCS